jgi:hypothetical protein
MTVEAMLKIRLNPFYEIFHDDEDYIHRQTLSSSLGQKIKNAFYAIDGNDSDKISVRLIDYLTLMVRPLAKALTNYIDYRNAGFAKQLLIFPLKLFTFVFNVVARIAAFALTLAALPVIALVHLVSSIVADSKRERALKLKLTDGQNVPLDETSKLHLKGDKLSIKYSAEASTSRKINENAPPAFAGIQLLAGLFSIFDSGRVTKEVTILTPTTPSLMQEQNDALQAYHQLNRADGVMPSTVLAGTFFKPVDRQELAKNDLVEGISLNK